MMTWLGLAPVNSSLQASLYSVSLARMVEAEQALLEQRVLRVLETELAEPDPELVYAERAFKRGVKQLDMEVSELSWFKKVVHVELAEAGMSGLPLSEVWVSEIEVGEPAAAVVGVPCTNIKRMLGGSWTTTYSSGARAGRRLASLRSRGLRGRVGSGRRRRVGGLRKGNVRKNKGRNNTSGLHRSM